MDTVLLALSWLFAVQIPVPAPQPNAQDQPEVRFGTTVYLSQGFEGQIYYIPATTEWMPNFKKLKPVGKIYASALNVPAQQFDLGFPGVTDRFEWFAIDYTGRFWIEKPGRYTWALISDDGSKLWVDGKNVVDNDGLHAPRGIAGYKTLKHGVHDLRVSYFQGPANMVALVLLIAAPGEELHVFRSEQFRPPSNAATKSQPK